MTEKMDDGGQAFPRGCGACEDRFCRHENGMTLRDHFAGQWLTNKHAAIGTGEQVASLAYAIADEMLKARARPAATEEKRD